MSILSGTFDIRPREILLNVHYGRFEFSSEFIDYVKERSVETSKLLSEKDWNSPEIRTDPMIIAMVKSFGLECSEGRDNEFEISGIPVYYAWDVVGVEYGCYETLHTYFPWAEFAIALATNDLDHTLVGEYKDGSLVGIEDKNPHLITPEEAAERDEETWGGWA
jgi:hypothetical protein